MRHFAKAEVQIKAGPDDGLGEGQFTAYASVFGNVDSYGDIVEPGAFKNTLADWVKSGNAIPVLWGHNMSDPDYYLGSVVAAEEDERGLKVTAQLDLDAPGKAATVYRLLKGRRVSQMSFAYDVLSDEHDKDAGATRLKELKLYEVSVVPIGANQETEILAVKAAVEALDGTKLGRVLAAKHINSLRTAQEAIGAVIAAAEGDDQEKASTEGPSPVDEEPDGAKSAEASPGVPVEHWATTIRLAELGMSS